jgi:ligand-binding sensor domain-containing protein
MFPKPSRRYVVVASTLLGILVIGALASQVLIAINKIGWSTISTDTSGLPNDAINDILSLPDGRMLVATNQGVGFWKAASKCEISDEWDVFNTDNSPLPDARVLSLAEDLDGAYWFGTARGLAKYDGLNWSVFGANEFGLSSEQVNAIAVDMHNNIWIGTANGAAVYDGTTWIAYSHQVAGLVNNVVFSIAINESAESEAIWFGTLSGVSMLDRNDDQWQFYTRQDINIGWGGVSDLMFDSMGRLWVCTEGGGISIWDGSTWSSIKVSNSKLPYSTIETVAELEPGEFWIAASIPNSAGGVLAKYDGKDWNTYRKGFTGYSGAETVVISKDPRGRYWFGTRNDGIETFEPKR